MSNQTLVIGAGVGGLAAAIRLAALGHGVTVLERQSGPGGKMRPVEFDGQTFDSGPTVLTMLWVFEELFAEAGSRLDEHVSLERLPVLARHFWSGAQSLDLFADEAATTAAIGTFAGQAAAAGYGAFARDSKRIHDSLRDAFLLKQRPTPFSLARAMPMTKLLQINPFESLWTALGRYFKDERLRQLFGRYATYCGASPFKAPATLMMVADVEAQGVWRVAGGMGQLAKALEAAAQTLGVRFQYDCAASKIEVEHGSIAAVIDGQDQRHPCSAIILNADSAAAAAGLFGHEAKVVASPLRPEQRSLSAITWCLKVSTDGPELSHHNVFFSDNYADEFRELLTGPAGDPTVYLCDQGNNRKLMLINAPANNEHAPEGIEAVVARRLARCGLTIDSSRLQTLRRDPNGFSQLYPATYGALYGRAPHGWMSTFQRPQARTKIPGLYLAGGYTHPGPGVPMAALSGRLAAEALIEDRALTRPYRGTVIAGGMSTR
jgi:1-hydroxycarotenoid 3,4-desaturase